MKRYSTFPLDLPPTALTIGTFDGVHLGHRALLNKLKTLSSFSTVLTFSNHPLEVLHPPAPRLLTSLPQKLSFIEEIGIDAVIAIPFTPQIAEMSYSDFLAPFSLTHLLLGYKSLFGKNREGTPENLSKLAKARGFHLEYMPLFAIDETPVSSRSIRRAIETGDLIQAEKLLGRKP